jgi:hypothetical protein
MSPQSESYRSDFVFMTYRYELRAMSYAFFMYEDYPPRLRPVFRRASAHRYSLRVEAYVGSLTDRYPPFRLAA